MGDESPIAVSLERLVGAWNARAARQFAGQFTVRADYVTGEGDWVRGREAIERLVEQAEPRPGVAIEGEPSVRVQGDVASVTFRWVAHAEGGKTARGVMTGVLVKTDEGWLFDRLQNTDVEKP